MADTKLTALSELSVLALDDLAYVVDDPAGTPVSNKISQNRVGGLLNRGVCQGRLTTESGVPVSTSDRTAQGTIYFTPYNGNLLTVYDGTRWKLYAFSEISLALTVTSGSNYDVFVYDNAGTLTLELSAAWTNDTTRSAAISLQDGIYVKDGATTRRWLGTIRASGSNVTADSTTLRFVWNAYNQLLRGLYSSDVSNSHTYTTATLREWNAGTGAVRLEIVVGSATSSQAWIIGNIANAAELYAEVDSVTAIVEPAIVSYNGNTSALIGGTPGLRVLAPGYHYFAQQERGSGAAGTFNNFRAGVLLAN